MTLAAGMACEGAAAGRRDLLDVPATRLRSVDSRRRAAESARDVRDRSRGSGRRRRRDPPGQLRPVVSALHSESGRHGAGRRERMPADAVHGGRSSINPAAVRYPRGQGPGVAIESAMRALPIGKAQVRREGRSGLAILAVGAMVPPCERIAEQLDATLVNLRFVKPLDEELILRLAATHRALVTVEENVVAGGAGSAINECLAAHGHALPTLNLGIPDRFIEHGSREDCLAVGWPRCARRSKPRSRAGGTCRRGRASAVLSGSVLRERHLIPQRRTVGPRCLRLYCCAASDPHHAGRLWRPLPVQTVSAHPAVLAHRRRAGACRFAPDPDQQGRHQGRFSSGARQGSLARRAAHDRELQHVRRPAAQLQGHAHVALRRSAAPERARDLGRVVPRHPGRDDREARRASPATSK